MPINKVDSISGDVYVIATDSEDAKRRALDYLRDESQDYMVFDDLEAAESRYYNRFLFVDRDQNSIYRFTLDVRAIEK